MPLNPPSRCDFSRSFQDEEVAVALRAAHATDRGHTKRLPHGMRDAMNIHALDELSAGFGDDFDAALRKALPLLLFTSGPTGRVKGGF